jgi:predicted ATPase
VSAVQYGHDTRVAALSYKSWALCQLGFADQANQARLGALKWAAELNHANTTGYAHFQGGLVSDVLQRRVQRTIDGARQAIRICDELALPLWRGSSRLVLGWALAHCGRRELSLTEIAAGIDHLHTRQGLLVVLMLGVAAEAQALIGDWAGAIVSIQEAFEVFDPGRDSAWIADLHRIRAFIWLRGQLSARDQAEADFHHAIEIAHRQSAKLLELRATTSLARLWGEQRRRREARDLLAPVYGWFTEGFDTADLKEAKALLAELT